jgi:hypothetical protein
MGKRQNLHPWILLAEVLPIAQSGESSKYVLQYRSTFTGLVTHRERE